VRDVLDGFTSFGVPDTLDVFDVLVDEAEVLIIVQERKNFLSMTLYFFDCQYSEHVNSP